MNKFIVQTFTLSLDMTIFNYLAVISSGTLCYCSITQSCPTLCNLTDCNMPGFPVLHPLPECAQTHVHWVDDPIQPSHPLSPSSPPALNLSKYQGLFQWVGSSHQVAKVLEIQSSSCSFLFWSIWEVASRTLFLRTFLYSEGPTMPGCFPHSPNKVPLYCSQFKAETGVVGVGWGTDLKLFPGCVLLFPLILHSENWYVMQHLGVSLGFSCSFIPSIHISADHQNVLWSLAPKYSVCCLLCLGWSNLTIQSVHHHLLPRGKHSNLTPCFSTHCSVSMLQSKLYRA